jgi:ssDNA-binding Zn-finger/Zn-ribbon topoisomerase 1
MVRLVNADFARLVAAALAKKPVPFAKVLEKVAEPENPRCGACGARTYYHVHRRVELFTCEDRCGWSVPLAGLQEANENSLGLHSKPDVLPATGQSCPQCGAQTVKRTGPFGSFYGCSRFPQCRGKWAPREMPPSN